MKSGTRSAFHIAHKVNAQLATRATNQIPQLLSELLSQRSAEVPRPLISALAQLYKLPIFLALEGIPGQFGLGISEALTAYRPGP